MTQEDNRKDAAVAETIGFIYIFAIVILSMSMIYVMGYPMLQSSMDESIFESTEQSFIVLQSDMKIVAFDQVPVKSLQIQFQGAALSVTNNSDITITYDGSESGNLYYKTGEVEYQKNDKFLTYENGGVWKRYPAGSLIVSNPRIYTSTMEYGTNRTNITTIGVVSLKGASSVGGSGIATFIMKHNESSIIKTQNPVNVTLRINSTYAAEWKNYLEGIGFYTANSTDSSLTALRNNTMLIAGQHLIEVDIT